MPRAVPASGPRLDRAGEAAAAASAQPASHGDAPSRRGGGAVLRALGALPGRSLLLTVLVLLGLWQFSTAFLLVDSPALIPPLDVARALWDDRALLITNTVATVRVAVLGFALGNLVAFALAIVFVLSRSAERILAQFTVALYALPTLVLAPILTFLLGPDNTKITVAALVAFFPTLVSVTTGLRAPGRDTIDLVRSLGGSRWTALVKVRLRWSLPYLCDGMRVAVPGALLGAIASEWLGADVGLGVFMVNALGYLNTARVWASCVVCVCLTLGGYAAVGLFNTVANRWYIDSTREPA